MMVELFIFLTVGMTLALIMVGLTVFMEWVCNRTHSLDRSSNLIRSKRVTLVRSKVYDWAEENNPI